LVAYGARTVDGASARDIFGLKATLVWCSTGEEKLEGLVARMHEHAMQEHGGHGAFDLVG
jgi:hypothetical protein